MAERTFGLGEFIFQEGEPGDIAYIIRSGTVELTRGSGSGQTVIARLGPDDILGEMSLVEERPRSLSAKAVEDVEVSSVTYDDFTNFLFEHPQDGVKYLRILFERLRTMNARVACQEVDNPPEPTTSESTVTLFPLNDKSSSTIPTDGLAVDRFPFRVGRYARGTEPDPLDMNDLYLNDSPPFNVSRNHFSLDRRDGRVFVSDRGSYVGVVVNGQHIGGHRVHAEATLDPGDNEIMVGAPHSPFHFKIVVT